MSEEEVQAGVAPAEEEVAETPAEETPAAEEEVPAEEETPAEEEAAASSTDGADGERHSLA